ncbi:uncharacterized protein A4U43_C03F32200 [Asparagus officinalis]|uniref:Uncharacterized protein n=1 Tax=Asparagus officinalis TaxID=4686 RepID=A0A5P1FGF2_ASPOF|nr:uncharacterized protein A4U43_C03F32200 [Asparagus officinalis]
MATIVGEAVLSNEMVAKYEEYLSSSSSGGNASRKCHRVVRRGRPQTVKASAPAGSTRVSSEEPTPTQSIKAKPEIERKGQGSAKWVAKRSPQTPIPKEMPAHSGTNCTATARGDALLVGRVNQQRRQMLVRQEVQTSVSHNGLNHYTGPRNARREGKLPDLGRPSKSGAPTEEGRAARPGGLRFSGHIPDANRSPRASEPTRVGESSKAGEPRHNHLADKRKGREVGDSSQTRSSKRRVETRLRTGVRSNAKTRQSRRDRPTPAPKHSTQRAPESTSKNLSYAHPSYSSEAGGCHQPPTEDLREYLTRKRTIHKANPQCHCERLIHTVLADCQCIGTAKPSVFERLSQQSS